MAQLLTDPRRYGEVVDELGLFPLGIVLLPGEQIPLHIFEPRYRELIGECLERDTEFGLLHADDGGLREIGTRARVTEVLERFDDGRLNVVVQGGDRFRVRALTSGRAFGTATVEDVEDEDDPADPAAEERARELFHTLREAVGVDLGEPPPGAFGIAGLLDFDVGAKQELLELRSERLRVARLVELLEKGIESLRVQKERGEIASRNGHFRSDG